MDADLPAAHEPLPYAYARGTWAVLATLALFQVVSLVESLAGTAVTFGLGRSGGVALGLGHAVVAIGGLATRGFLLVRAVRLPRRSGFDPLPTWKPVLLTVAAILATLLAHAARTAGTALFARDLGVEVLGRLSFVVAVIGSLANLAEQVLLLVALWIAFVRGRDVLGPAQQSFGSSK